VWTWILIVFDGYRNSDKVLKAAAFETLNVGGSNSSVLCLFYKLERGVGRKLFKSIDIIDKFMQAEGESEEAPFTDPEMMIDVGNEYLGMKKYRQAVAIFEKIIKNEPGLTHIAKAYNGCGIAYAEAIEQFEEALNLSRYLVDFGARTYRNLAQVYELLGEEDKAKENREKAETIELSEYHFWVTMSDELE